jgi:hypothetical protein
VTRESDFLREVASRLERADIPYMVSGSLGTTAEVGGVRVQVVSPEDAILSKLEWAKESESERQLRDAAGVAATQGDRLDFEYLRKWAADLGVSDLLEKIL